MSQWSTGGCRGPFWRPPAMSTPARLAAWAQLPACKLVDAHCGPGKTTLPLHVRSPLPEFRGARHIGHHVSPYNCCCSSNSSMSGSEHVHCKYCSQTKPISDFSAANVGKGRGDDGLRCTAAAAGTFANQCCCLVGTPCCAGRNSSVHALT